MTAPDPQPQSRTRTGSTAAHAGAHPGHRRWGGGVRPPAARPHRDHDRSPAAHSDPCPNDHSRPQCHARPNRSLRDGRGGDSRRDGASPLLAAGPATQSPRRAGWLAEADPERVNLAQILRDGDQVHVFAVAIDDGEVALATPSDAGIVYINAASAGELETLPHIGPALAARIVAYREENGAFTSLEDLDNVSGIGPSILTELAPYLSFEVR